MTSSTEPITQPDPEPATDTSGHEPDDSNSDVATEAGRGEWETVHSERDHYLDALQRSQAEFANYRQRVARDRAVAGEQARNGVWQRVLPLIDAIDSARHHDDTAGRLWTVACDVLARDDVDRIAPEPGDRFDPTTQHAVASTAGLAAEVVVSNLIRPGYRLGDQILRAADVEVAAEAAASGSGEGAANEGS